MAKLIFGCGYLGLRVARRWRDAPHDHIAHLALGVARNDVDGARRPHAMTWTGWPSTSHLGVMPRPGASLAVMKPLSRRGASSAIETVT